MAQRLHALLRTLPVGAVALIIGCTDSRPEVAEATEWFETRYPVAALSDVEMTEDEVIARSFRFHYHSGDGFVGGVEFQFIEDSAGTWAPTPTAPATLP